MVQYKAVFLNFNKRVNRLRHACTGHNVTGSYANIAVIIDSGSCFLISFRGQLLCSEPQAKTTLQVAITPNKPWTGPGFDLLYLSKS